MQKQSERNITLRIVSSNDVNHLADALAQEFFSPSSRPFDKRLIIIPHPALKDFLTHRFLSHPALNIAAGMQILPLNQAVLEIKDFSKRMPSFLELSLHLEAQLQHSDVIEQFPDLVQYLGLDPEIRERRVALLSDALARLFARYGLYGHTFLSKWLNTKGWQQFLWQTLFSLDTPWAYPLEALKNVGHFSGKIALFGFSHLSLAHLNFFSTLSTSFYHLSPCALFWQDQASDKQRLFQTHKDESHPLLGNWGKLGRQLLKSLECFQLVEEEGYQEPKNLNLLNSLKRSLLTLDDSEELIIDNSLQIHSATSKFREVEVLRDTLETLLQMHADRGDPIAPREICVVCPDIAAYTPYIEMVFSQSSFSYAITGLPLSTTSEAVRGFLQLLHLPEERFALSSLLKCLRCLPLMQKWDFSLEEITELQQWFKQAHIRSRLSEHSNSWEKGIDRLLQGLALIPDENNPSEIWPLACIAHSEIELFNRFLEFFSVLKRDLLLLSSKKTTAEWFAYLVQLAVDYLVIEWEREPFFQELKSLALSCRSLNQQPLEFDSLKRVLNHLAQKPSGDISSSQLQHITFTSLQLGNLGSARVIWCLGLDEEAFPRRDAPSSLCEMTRVKSADYIPLKIDEDRMLFLELLLKAQEYLIMSYQRVHPDDGKHQGPSLLIEELNQYLQKRGQTIPCIDHPTFPFDASYFSADAPIKKWAPSDLLAARAHYFPHHEPIPFFAPKSLTPDTELTLDIRQLKKLARHPLQFYFNETLNMYLHEEQDEEQQDFLISHLRKAALRKKALHASLPQVLNQSKAEGALPQGLFQDVAIQQLEEEVRDLLQELHMFGVRPEQIYSIEFSAACLEQEKTETLLPPLSINSTFQIIGKLEDITPKGLLFHGSNDLKSLVKAWPLYLIYRCLNPAHRYLLLTKSGAICEFPLENPHASLAAYLEYYLLAKHTPSPLLPEWAKSLLQGSMEDWKVELHHDDPYFDYVKRRDSLFDPQEVFPLWSPKLRNAFAPLLEKNISLT